ncbi:MAG: hypothetical protein HND40_13630 [Ignavibacteriota bacterium]|nr:MAG: hypothetical protein HND40_13630 [Ignavibacteriota bacterium]
MPVTILAHSSHQKVQSLKHQTEHLPKTKGPSSFHLQDCGGYVGTRFRF